MGGQRGVKETTEAAAAVFAFVQEAGRLSRDGVQITDGLQLIANKELIGKAMTAFIGRELIDDEMKELDAEDSKALFQFFIVELGNTFDAFGVTMLKSYLEVIPDALELGEINYVRGKAIFEKIQSARAAVRKDVV